MIVGSNPRVCIDHDTHLMRLCKFLDFLWAEIQLLLDFMKIQWIRSPHGSPVRGVFFVFCPNSSRQLRRSTSWRRCTQPQCPHSWQLPSMPGLSLLPSHSAPLSLTAHTAGCPRVSPAPSSVSLSQPQSAWLRTQPALPGLPPCLSSPPAAATLSLSAHTAASCPPCLVSPFSPSHSEGGEEGEDERCQDDHEGIGWRWRAQFGGAVWISPLTETRCNLQMRAVWSAVKDLKPWWVAY